MFSHVHLGTADLDRAVRFYGAVLEPLGIVQTFIDAERGWAGWKPADADRPLFVVGRPLDGAAPGVGNGQMVAFQAAERRIVDQCHRRALAAGATDEGAPGLRPEYHAEFYGAYFRDPDGNKLCVCCHAPE